MEYIKGKIGGCRAPKVDVRDYKVNAKKAGAINLPEKFELTNLPRVKNQGVINSCVAHASSSALEYYTKNSVKLSTNFIYGMERRVCGEEEPGMYLMDACKIIQLYGDMIEDDCPGNTEVPECSKYVEAMAEDNGKMERAKPYHISSYYACNTNNDIKYAIMTYGPVLGSIYWHDEGKFIDRDATIEFDENSDGGYHCVLVYGWDERGFKIQNSWGEEFGKKGRFILPYKYEIAEARIMIDDATEGNPAINAALIKKSNFKGSKIINKIINTFKKKH